MYIVLSQEEEAAWRHSARARAHATKGFAAEQAAAVAELHAEQAAAAAAAQASAVSIGSPKPRSAASPSSGVKQSPLLARTQSPLRQALLSELTSKTAGSSSAPSPGPDASLQAALAQEEADRHLNTQRAIRAAEDERLRRLKERAQQQRAATVEVLQARQAHQVCGV